MKRKAILIMAAVLMFFGTAEAQQYTKKYTLYLGTSDTGVTTPVSIPLSGVTDPLLIYDGYNYKRLAADTSLMGLNTLPSGNAILHIDEVTASQAQVQMGGNYSGNTFFVCAKFGHAGSNFSLLEKIPITPFNLAISGITSFGFPFQIPPGTEKAQFFFGPSGVTQYGNFKASLMVGLSGTNWSPPPPIVISEGVFVMPASGTGVSEFTSASIGAFPDGVRYAEFSVSGASAYFTADGLTVPSASTPIGTHAAALSTFWLTDEARNLKIAPALATARTIHYRLMTRKP